MKFSEQHTKIAENHSNDFQMNVLGRVSTPLIVSAVIWKLH